MPSPNVNLVYDGKCALCAAFVRWVKARDRSDLILPVPYQNSRELKRLGLRRIEARRQVYTVEEGLGKKAGAAAINRVLEILGGPWKVLAKAYSLRPVAFMEDGIYRWVSRNRHWIGPLLPRPQTLA